MKSALNDFNQDTLFDYFAILGTDNDQLRQLIHDVKEDYYSQHIGGQ
jgi:hypothetical protein